MPSVSDRTPTASDAATHGPTALEFVDPHGVVSIDQSWCGPSISQATDVAVGASPQPRRLPVSS